MAKEEEVRRQTPASPSRSVSSVEEEGLGENYLETAWIQPDKQRAWEHRRSLMYEEGRANILKVSIDNLCEMGVGVAPIPEQSESKERNASGSTLTNPPTSLYPGP